MTAVIGRAEVVGGHDGRAEVLVELTYDNGGTAVVSLEEEACLASLDEAGVGSIADLVGQPWTVVLPALGRPRGAAGGAAGAGRDAAAADAADADADAAGGADDARAMNDEPTNETR